MKEEKCMSYELSENTLDYTLELLLQHCKNKQKFKKDAHLTVIGGEDNKDYTNKGIRRSRKWAQGNFWIYTLY